MPSMQSSLEESLGSSPSSTFWQAGQTIILSLLFITSLTGHILLGLENYIFNIFISILSFLRTLLVIGGVTVFLVIFHSFFFLLYRMRLVCSKQYKVRKEMARDGSRKQGEEKSEALLDNYQTKGELEC